MTTIYNPIVVQDLINGKPRAPLARISGNLDQVGGRNFGSGRAPTYSGNELFLYTAATAVGRAVSDKTSLFQTDGWQYCKSLPLDVGARGWVYTDTPDNIASNPLIDALPSGRVRCLAIEATCYSDYYNNQGQCTATVQYGQTTGAVGQVPADLWFSFWIFAPDMVTGDVPVFTGFYDFPATYVDATHFDVPGHYLDMYYIGNEVRLTLSGSTPISTITDVSFSGGTTHVTIADAVCDATLTASEHKSWTKGWSEGKMMYATRAGYPATCANDGYVWDLIFQPTNRAGIDGQDVCAGGAVPCTSQHLGIDPSYTGCGNTQVNTQDNSGSFGNNLNAEPAIRPGVWIQIKGHIDITGTNPNCSSGQGAYELWTREYGVATFTKKSEWYGGQTVHNGNPITWIPNFTDGMKAIKLPGTVGGANKYNGNWWDQTWYIDDYCLAASEAALPIYYDAT